MAEVVDEGVTGFLALLSSRRPMPPACDDRPAGCRARARQRFSADRMVADYADLSVSARSG
jgi:hypothetical protein